MVEASDTCPPSVLTWLGCKQRMLNRTRVRSEAKTRGGGRLAGISTYRMHSVPLD